MTRDRLLFAWSVWCGLVMPALFAGGLFVFGHVNSRQEVRQPGLDAPWYYGQPGLGGPWYYDFDLNPAAPPGWWRPEYTHTMMRSIPEMWHIGKRWYHVRDLMGRSI